MKLYSFIAVVGFILFLVGFFTKLDSLSLVGICTVLLCVGFNLNDNLRNAQ